MNMPPEIIGVAVAGGAGAVLAVVAVVRPALLELRAEVQRVHERLDVLGAAPAGVVRHVRRFK